MTRALCSSRHARHCSAAARSWRCQSTTPAFAAIHCRHAHSARESAASASSDTTHFGFSWIPTASKESAVGEVFHRVASRYDVMNDLMSAGIHRLWKQQLVARLAPQPGMRHIDVAGGTGDIAFRFIEEMRRVHGRSASGAVTVCDINPSMLGVGRQRATDFGYLSADSHTGTSAVSPVALSFVEGNAEHLPFADDSFDSYTIAFGLRNVTDIDQAVRDAHRVLKRGGHFMCLEFSQLPSPIMQRLYDAYSFNVIPVIGELVAGDRASYQYLVESIRKFPEASELVDRMRAAGFKQSRFTRLSQGIVAVHEGFKV